MKKPSIPSEPTDQFSKAVRQNIEIIKGDRGIKLKQLPSNASLSDVIGKINEIITLLQ